MEKEWRDISRRVMTELKDDHVQTIAAGTAFYFFLALFPAIAASLSIYGLIMEPGHVEAQIGELTRILPDQAHQMIAGVLHDFSTKSNNTLGWNLLINMMISLWGANKGTKAIFKGVSIAYEQTEKRNYFLTNGITLLFTLGSIFLGFICLGLVVVFSAFIEKLNLSPSIQSILEIARWFILAFVIVIALELIYRIAPNRKDPKFRWVTCGAVVATVLWLAGSFLFSYYVDNFSSFDRIYGSFAAIIILLVWLLFTAYLVLLGAEINSEMEHHDTTTGKNIRGAGAASDAAPQGE